MRDLSTFLVFVASFLAAAAIIDWFRKHLLTSKSYSKEVEITSPYRRLLYCVNSAPVLLGAVKMRGKGSFKIKTIFGREQINVFSEALIIELGKVSDRIISFEQWTRNILQFDHMMPNFLVDNAFPPSHGPSTHAITALFGRSGYDYTPFLRERLVSNIERVLKDYGTKNMNGSTTISLKIFLSNVLVIIITELLLGPQIASDEKFVKALEYFCRKVAVGALVVTPFPKWLKPFAAKYLTGNVGSSREYIIDVLRTESLKRYDNHTAKKGKENNTSPRTYFDMIVDGALVQKKYPLEPALRQVLLSLFASTYSSIFTNSSTIMEFATRPEYHATISDEIRSCVAAAGGWKIEALNQMHMLESFMKEAQRHRPFSLSGIGRIAKREYTFADGTSILPGQHIGVAVPARYQDPKLYPNPEVFDGFRFCGSPNGVGFAEPSPSWLLFGGGRHACPGRYFAMNLSKVMESYLLLEYDFKLVGGTKPRHWTFEEQSLPIHVKATFTRKTKDA